MQTVLIITSITNADGAPQRDVLGAFVAALNVQGKDLQVAYCAVQQLVFAVRNGQPTIEWEGRELHANYAVLHLRNANLYGDYANALRLYCQHHGMQLINEGDATAAYSGKVGQGFLYAYNEISTPDLLSSPNNQTLLGALGSEPYAYPYIVKHTLGIKGQHNYLIQNQQQLAEVLGGELQGFMAQPFVANTGELRVLTFGQAADPLVFQKTAVAGTHLNNTSQGGTVQARLASDIDPAIIAAARRAAALTGRLIAGIDVLLATDGSWLILEANATPSLATGALAEQKVAFYASFMQQLAQQEGTV